MIIDAPRVVTGASEGIGRAYAFALAERGMNVVIISRTKETLEKVAKEIGETTGQRVKVIVADFSEENVFREIEEELKDLNVGVLVNNVGVLPSIIPCKFLNAEELDKIFLKRHFEDVISSSSAYPGPGRGDSRFSRDTQTSLSPDTSSSSSRGSPRRSQASRET
ncbi:hypothetical protein CHARACLAT_032569 [Characodon lateralis]|uniref:SDR family NAD(P)-dependent oxidoreductase n=1 Tax=Characodon lateralis TaxID=208331 RepID=A0ABU7DW32_9TELE|nr:hypothetical protein [Characodon lateralis]